MEENWRESVDLKEIRQLSELKVPESEEERPPEDLEMLSGLDTNRLASSLDLAKDIITKDYLYKLEQYEVAEMSENLKNVDITEYTRIYKLNKIISDKKESVIDKLVTLLNAAYTSNATIVAIILGNGNSVEYYLGVVSKDIQQEKDDITAQGEMLQGVLAGNFPGMEIDSIQGNRKEELLKKTFYENYITAVSGIASIRNEKDNTYEKYVQGIEHLVDALSGKKYSIVVVADPINTQEIATAKYGYETLYTQLSPFLKTSISFNESESINLTNTHTDGITNTIGESVSLTQNYSKTKGWNESDSYGKDQRRETGSALGTIVGGALGAAAGVAATVVSGGAAASLIPSTLYVGSQIGAKLGNALIGSSGKNSNSTTGTSGSDAISSGNNVSKNESKSEQSSDAISEAEGKTHGKTIQLSNENKTVKNLLGHIDKQIERLRKCESYGAFNCAAYVISSDPETNGIVSSGYNALMRGDNSSLQASYINTWNANEEKGKSVKEYLTKLSHPLFTETINEEVFLSPASVSNSYEVAVSIGFPKKSIAGLPVFEMAAFGRNVLETNVCGKAMEQIKLGNIFHMGREENISVNLNLKSLAMHTFITGSTGSGKSNTVYQILRELKEQRIHYLVIEPAKGEYKHVFGNDDTEVYGTNPYISPLLKLNPFRFPEGIHVLEHIDRLIEIFNVCWPMYAAMPAVLKDSVERAYINAGWDLTLSKNKYSDELFPTFADVLIELNHVVDESGFSQEVKDNYTGSLSTRIKSLTNGIYGRIFDSDELGDKKLFDENVIVDLSRVGSVETKAMIMGILIMRLQEYRMTSGVMNADLNHVTVLEEAHNLLKRTSTEQSSESSNLLGKSVEMLSNAIAEVRTYGEGFIIVDQAPGLLDMSVIRNTNTKIIMRLPDAEDRNLVGKSANLSDEQIKELAKIPTGVAGVYQNNWLEPVLCKVAYKDTESIYINKDNPMREDDDLKKVLITQLLDKAAGERLDVNVEGLLDEIIRSSLSTKIKRDSIKVLRRNAITDLSNISSIVYDLVCTPEIEAGAEDAESIKEWSDAFLYADDSVVSDLDEIQQNNVIECILREQIERYNKPVEYLEKWHKYMRGEIM